MKYIKTFENFNEGLFSNLMGEELYSRDNNGKPIDQKRSKDILIYIKDLIRKQVTDINRKDKKSSSTISVDQLESKFSILLRNLGMRDISDTFTTINISNIYITSFTKSNEKGAAVGKKGDVVFFILIPTIEDNNRILLMQIIEKDYNDIIDLHKNFSMEEVLKKHL